MKGNEKRKYKKKWNTCLIEYIFPNIKSQSHTIKLSQYWIITFTLQGCITLLLGQIHRSWHRNTVLYTFLQLYDDVCLSQNVSVQLGQSVLVHSSLNSPEYDRYYRYVFEKKRVNYLNQDTAKWKDMIVTMHVKW